MKYILILTAVFLSRVAAAQSPACAEATTPGLRAVFALAIGLNDNLERIALTGEATPEYHALRERIAEFDARRTLPCAQAAAQLLQESHDAALARSLLALVADREKVAARPLAPPIATFFDARPEEFSLTLGGFPTSARCRIVANLDAGWTSLRSAVDPARATARDTVLADLKRVHSCDRAKTPPPVQVPRNRERSIPGQRQSRPRWAFSAPSPVLRDAAGAGLPV